MQFLKLKAEAGSDESLIVVRSMPVATPVSYPLLQMAGTRTSELYSQLRYDCNKSNGMSLSHEAVC